jgi:hypothetical protein
LVGFLQDLLLVFIGSGSMKVLGSEEAIKGAATMGISAGTLKLIGVLEIICVLLFAIPRTGLLGTLLPSAYIGGAIATHLEHQIPIFAPIILQCIVWITAVIRFPELSRRLIGKNTSA